LAAQVLDHLEEVVHGGLRAGVLPLVVIAWHT
jgi:hypothetical protein